MISCDSTRGILRALEAMPRESAPKDLLATHIPDWSLLNAVLNHHERHMLIHGDSVRTGSFSSDRYEVLTAGLDGVATIWDENTGKVRAALHGHDDGVVRLWDPQVGNIVAVILGHEGHVKSVSFDRSGQSLLTAADDSTARVWIVGGQKLVDLAQSIVPRSFTSKERRQFGLDARMAN